MKNHLLFFWIVLLNQSCSISPNLGMDFGSAYTPPATISYEEIAGDYDGSIKYWINDQEYLQDLSKEYGYQTSVRMVIPGHYVISFDSTFLYQLPELHFEVVGAPHPNTIYLDTGQVYDHWMPFINNLYAGHFNIDTKTRNIIWFSFQIQSVDQDSLRMFSISGERDLD